MKKPIGNLEIVLKKGDITEENVSVIVNAANTSLLGGGGVDGAIHRAGGPNILEACKKIGGCKTGEAVITTAGRLPAEYVVHTVGPVWHGGCRNEEALLKSAYQNSLNLAADYHAASIAFPSISTGAYRFPIEKAASAALNAVKEFSTKETSLKEVRFILFSDEDLAVYLKSIKTL